MVVVEGTDYVGSVVHSDFVVRMATEAHNDADTNFDIDWVGTVHDDTIFVPVHPN